MRKGMSFKYMCHDLIFYLITLLSFSYVILTSNRKNLFFLQLSPFFTFKSNIRCLTFSYVMWKMTKQTLKIFWCLHRKISKYVHTFNIIQERVNFSRQLWNFFENLQKFTILTYSKVLSIYLQSSILDYECRSNNRGTRTMPIDIVLTLFNNALNRY